MPSPVEVASRLSVVVDLQQEVLASLADAENIMRLVVERTPDATGGTGAAIGLVHGDDIVFRAASGVVAGRNGYCIPLDASLTGRALRAGEAIRCNNTELDSRVDGEAAREIGVRSLIAAPLLDGSRAFGALLTFSPNADAFSDLDTYTLQVLAGITASALVQAGEFRVREASERRYRLMFERNIAGVFRSTLDGRILDCNEAMVRYFGYDSKDELCAQTAWDLYERKSDRMRLLETMSRHNAVRNARVNFRRKDGSAMVGLISISRIPSEEGEGQLLGTLVEESQ